jgi:hypothetical protein
MLLDRIEGKDNFFRKDVLRAKPEEPFGRGEVTRASLSCDIDDVVSIESWRLARLRA